MKKILIILCIFVFASLIGASCKTLSPVTQSSSSSSSENAPYYSKDAKVMEFYSDYCAWCIKEKDILADLAKDGYKVKPMNVGEHQNYWKDYGISGTPTFVASDGTKLVGYLEKDKLKAFLDKYK
jgi:protein-disulfide isomerase